MAIKYVAANSQSTGRIQTISELLRLNGPSGRCNLSFVWGDARQTEICLKIVASARNATIYVLLGESLSS
jgi:hypothetical protein